MKRSAPMKRTAFKIRHPDPGGKPFVPGKRNPRECGESLARSPMKQRRRKVGEVTGTGIVRSDKIRAAARGQACTLRIIGVCNSNPETTVWAHANGLRFGKGIGHKSSDLLGAFACCDCHGVYDGQKQAPKLAYGTHTKDAIELDFWRGHGESLIILDAMGLI